MLIRMLANITGNCDGVQLLPPPGVIELHDASALDFIAKRYAEQVDEDGNVIEQPVPEPEADEAPKRRRNAKA